MFDQLINGIMADIIQPYQAITILRTVFPVQCANASMHMKKKDVLAFIHGKRFKNLVFPAVDTITDPLLIMDTLNKMVKDKQNCPKSVKNQFYTHNHSIIMYLYDIGRITKIIDQGSVYLFEIDGGLYAFHQPANYFEDMIPTKNIPFEKGEQYVPNSNEHIQFNEELFKMFRLNILLSGGIKKFMSKYNYV